MKRGFKTYDIDEIYNIEVLGEETIQDKIDQINRERKKMKYKVRTHQCGDYLETEIFPVYERNKDIPRRDKNKASKESQKKLNDKKSQKKLIRLINTNFKKGDLALDLTYEGKHIPTYEEAQRDIRNYLRRLSRFRKKNGMEPLKYIYVIEFLGEDEKGKTKKVRIHHHLIINAMERDVAEELWGKGRANSDRLQPDENGMLGKALYIAKHSQKKGMRTWVPSKNLKKPIVHESISKLSRRKAQLLALDPNNWKEIFESLYKQKYKFNSCDRYISDITGGFYLYARMVRRI